MELNNIITHKNKNLFISGYILINSLLIFGISSPSFVDFVFYLNYLFLVVVGFSSLSVYLEKKFC
jgi:hypothetical protein